MKIETIQVTRYRRPMTRLPGRSAGAASAVREGLILRLTGSAGTAGFGEAAPLPGYSPDDLSGAEACIGRLFPVLPGRDAGDTPDDISRFVSELVPLACPSVRFALETALFDLSARAAGLPLARWLNPRAPDRVQVNGLLDIHASRSAAAAEITGRGYRAVKIKTTGDARALSDLLTSVRSALGDGIRIRLDANRAWPLETAARVIRWLDPFDLEYVEEPLRRYDAREYRLLKEKTGGAVALDESVSAPPGPERIAADGACDVFVLKPTVLGGLWRTFNLVSLARQSGLDAVITTTMETETGTAAALHLAAASRLHRPAGLDTLRFFESHEPDLVRVVDGAIALPRGPGLAVEPVGWNRQ